MGSGQSTSDICTGADISFLSAFPDEKEYLFPPLTSLHPTRQSTPQHSHAIAGMSHYATVCYGMHPTSLSATETVGFDRPAAEGGKVA